jgi:AcrR family transcriptional regulator
VNLPTARGLERRQSILDAALHCFLELGYSATTVDDIRAESGASIGSIYHFFAGKEQLASALYLEGLASYQDGVLAALESYTDAAAAVRAVVHHHLDWVAANPELSAFLLHVRHSEATEKSAGDVRAMRKKFFRRALAALQPHIDAGRIRDLPGPVLVALIIGPVQELVRYWLKHRDENEAKLAREVLPEQAWLAVRGKKS